VLDDFGYQVGRRQSHTGTRALVERCTAPGHKACTIAQFGYHFFVEGSLLIANPAAIAIGSGVAQHDMS